MCVQPSPEADIDCKPSLWLKSVVQYTSGDPIHLTEISICTVYTLPIFLSETHCTCTFAYYCLGFVTQSAGQIDGNEELFEHLDDDEDELKPRL